MFCFSTVVYNPIRSLAVVSLAFVSVAASLTYAQPPSGISVKVTRGDSVFNDLAARTAQPITVLVTTPDGRPVSGATVLFEATPGLATVLFEGGDTVTASTDLGGFATAPPAVAKGVGIAKVRVTAAYGGKVGNATLAQRNYVAPSAAPKEQLEIKLLTGDGENRILPKGAQDIRFISVMVSIDGKPIGGAKVTFRLPFGAGPNARFPTSEVAEVMSDAKGVATSPLITPNSIPGEFKVPVRAEIDGLVATMDVIQVNRVN